MHDDDLINKAKAELKDAYDFDTRDPLFGLSRQEMSGPKLSRRATLRLLAAGGALTMARSPLASTGQSARSRSR